MSAEKPPQRAVVGITPDDTNLTEDGRLVLEVDSRDHEVDLRHSRSGSSRRTCPIAARPAGGSDRLVTDSYSTNDSSGYTTAIPAFQSSVPTASKILLDL
jgi:hypothetical protein